MNIYLQMMILGMFLKYCYALTRIQQKKQKNEEMKWHLLCEGNSNVTRPSYISPPQHKCRRFERPGSQSVQNLNIRPQRCLVYEKLA